MLNISLLIVFFITNTATFLCSMDQASKRTSKELSTKRKSLPKAIASVGPFEKKYKPSPLSTIKEIKSPHGLLIAIENNNLARIEMYLSNPHLNLSTIKDINGDTPLHYASRSKNFDFIENCLTKTNVDFSIKNKHAITIMKYIPQDVTINQKAISCSKEKIPTLRAVVFARASVDGMVNIQVDKYRPHYEEGSITKEILIKISEETVKKAQEDEKTQETHEDRAIPKFACYPDYATVEFIYQMILFRLAQQDSQ